MAKRIEDMSPEGYLELQKDDSGISISVYKDPDSREIGNSVQFCNDGSLSPNVHKVLRTLFESGEKSREDISIIQTNTTKDVLELFIEKDGDIIVSTKPETVRIDFENMTQEIRNSLEELYETIIKENEKNPIN